VARRAAVYGPPKPVHPTELNVWALKELAKGRVEFPNQVHATDAPHIRRCLAGGLVEVSADRRTLKLTPEGVLAVMKVP
jgi:hypothetical protein